MPFSTKKILKKLLIYAFCSMMVIFLTSCTKASLSRSENTQNCVEKSTLLLDTVVSIKLFCADEQAGYEMIDRCFEECRRYEQIFSRTDSQSELFMLNERGSMTVSDDLVEVLRLALYYCDLSDGRFDITLGKISDLYAFSSDSPRVPSPDTINKNLSHCGYQKIMIDGNVVTLSDPEASIDLGAIAKGYIADRLADFLIENGQNSAVISLGGNIVCVGSKENNDFHVGIKTPERDTTETIAIIGVSNCSVVTSGIYERAFEKDGILYHHILSPEDGLPLRNSLLSVSVVSENSADADALSTVCFSLGLEAGLNLIDSIDGACAVFITDDMSLHYSEGFEQLLVD